jgi:hypothetical protein
METCIDTTDHNLTTIPAMTSTQPILKQIAAIRRKAGLTRQEFFDHHFQIHGTLSDGGDQKPA